MKPFEAIRRGASSQTGMALPMALMIMLLVSVLGLTVFSLGMTEVTIGTTWRAYSTAFYGAEAGVESGVVGLRDLLAQTSTPTDAQLTAIAPPTLSDPKLKFAAFSVTRALPSPPYTYQTTFTTGTYAGLYGIVTDYRVNAQVTGDGGTRANISQIVKHVQIPLFQFAIFYGRGVDMEIEPGPIITVNGRVHANSSIYLAPDTGAKFDSYVTTAGKIYRLDKDDGKRWANPDIKDANGNYKKLDFDSEYKPGFTSKWKSEAEWKAYAQSVFGPGGKESTVKDRAMGVTEIIPPVPELSSNPSNPDVVSHQLIEMPKASDSAELTAAKLYSQADLRIVDGVATDANGNTVSLPSGLLNTRTFWDHREQRDVTVTDVNMAILKNVAPANGVLYVGSTGGPGNAVRLVNGKQLPDQGLTVVSQNPVYVAGDYNTINKVPAAVMADAITVLSKNWLPQFEGQAGAGYDTKGKDKVTYRKAQDTTVNAAFALGPSSESQMGKGNGQVENVIRFLEDWEGGKKRFTYQGSIVSLWHSQQATAPWRSPSASDSYYKPPIRNWSYDPMFNTTPPPGTPSAIVVTRGSWSQQ